MFGKIRYSRWLVGAAILAAAECASVAAIEIALTDYAQAQFFRDDRNSSRSRPQRSGGFFESLFGPSNRRLFEGDHEQVPVDNSRAPSPRKVDPKAEPVVTTTSIVVMGDGMADWLAYGLEDAFSDAPEIGIVRKHKTHSGLLRYESKGDLDWWHVARDNLTQEKPNYVIMMLGVSDRQNIREKDLAKEVDQKKPGDPQDPDNGDKADDNQSSIISPEPPSGKKANGIIEFRSDQWAQIYSRRIDETIAALKSKGVPVFWVGLPSIRGTRSTADVAYLNDLYRARAEKAGAVYIDVWDGFVDEAGKFTSNGPDYEGQLRRLRSGDGVYFTKYGARKLAHYVERELRRYMSNRALQISLPSGPMPAPGDGKSAVRPLAGPVVPLTVIPGNSDELLGGAGTGAARADAIATQVLVKGEPVAAPVGRADDFVWRQGNDANASAPAAPVVAIPATPVNAPAATEIKPPAPKVVEPKVEPKGVAPKNGAAGKTTQNGAAKQKRAEENKPRPPQNVAPRPPQPAGPFGWLR